MQFITTSTYRRTPVFSIPSFPQLFVQALRAARSKFGFLWVLMPEHFHLLFRPWPPQATPEMIKVCANPPDLGFSLSFSG